MQSLPDDSLRKRFEENRRAFEQNMIGFLQTELEVASAFLKIAKTGGESSQTQKQCTQGLRRGRLFLRES